MDASGIPVLIKMFYGSDTPAVTAGKIGTMINDLYLSVSSTEDVKEKKINIGWTEKEFNLHSLKNFRVIIVYNNKIASSAIEEEYVLHPFVEVFDVNHLFVNPTKHIYQPSWRLMSQKEITELMSKYDARTSLARAKIVLGSVCVDDPINKYYGGRPGVDVYEIIRDGTSIYYRKVTSKRMNIKKKTKNVV